MAMRSPVSAIDPNGRGGDERGREEGRQQAASPLRLSESSVARLMLAADTGRKGADSWKKTEGGEDGGSGTQTLVDTPDNGDEKMSTRWECVYLVKMGDE